MSPRRLKQVCAVVCMVIALTGTGYAVLHDFTTSQWIVGCLASIGVAVAVCLALDFINRRSLRPRP